MSLISVIIPVYNAEKYLKRCIDSVIAQTYKELEIILIDDGSSDRSGAICDEYAWLDDRIKVIHKENSGVSSARNDGLDVAKGSYISFIDSDDYIAPDYFQVLLYNIGNSDMVVCNFKTVYDEGAKKRIYNMINSNRTVSSVRELFSDCADRYIYTYVIWAKLYKADRLKNVRFNINIAYGEDSFFIREVFAKCSSVAMIVYDGYFYRISPTNVTSDANRFVERKLGYVLVQRETAGFCRKNGFDSEANAHERFVVKGLYSIINSLISKKHRCSKEEKAKVRREIKNAMHYKITRAQKCKMRLKLLYIEIMC